MESKSSLHQFWCGFRLVTWFVIILSSTTYAQFNASFSWNEKSIGLTQNNIKSIQCNKVNPEYLLCVSDDSIYLSTDFGSSWRSVMTISSRRSIVDADSDEYAEAAEDDEEEEELNWDESDLRREGVLQDDESLDDIDENELRDRLKEAGLLESLETEEETKQVFPEKTGKMPGFIKVVWDPTGSEIAYAITRDSVFNSTNRGVSWNKIWSSTGDSFGQLKFVDVTYPNGILVIGSDRNLIYSTNHGSTFTPVAAFDKNTDFFDVIRDPHSNDGLLVADKATVYLLQLPDKISTLVIAPVTGSDRINKIAVEEGTRVAVSTISSLFCLRNDDSWNRITPLDIRSALIQDVIWLDNSIVIASNRGVFFADANGLAGQFRNTGLWELNINDLDYIRRENTVSVWAATKSGVFLFEKSEEVHPEKSTIRMSEIQDQIPRYSELVVAALRYAELDVFQTRSLISASSKSVWFPMIQLDMRGNYDEDTTYDRARTISISNNNVFIGPDDQTYRTQESENYRIQLRLRWYPQIKTSHDYLTVHKQLRADYTRRQKLLNELNQLYGEYKEKALLGRSQFSGDFKTMLDFEFLKARLDCLTGFYLSDNLNLSE